MRTAFAQRAVSTVLSSAIVLGGQVAPTQGSLHPSVRVQQKLGGLFLKLPPKPESILSQ